jgi:hypothetical protein
MVKVKVKYSKTKYRSVGILLIVNAIVYFKCKLQLKFRTNANCSSVAVNIPTGLRYKQHLNLKLKIMNNKIYLHKGPPTATLSLLSH